MLTVLKLTVVNMKQKKFRSILIILSIVLSVGLMYTVLSLSSSITTIFEQEIKTAVGSAELMISPEENSGEQYMPKLEFDQLKGMFYAIPLVTAYGYSELKEDMVPIAFTGMSEKDYDTIYELEFTQKTTEKLTGNQVFIGKEAAAFYQVTLGEEIKINIGGEDNLFKITGILEDQNNNLGHKADRLALVVAKDTLANILGVESQVNAYYLKSLPEVGKSSLITELERDFPELEIVDITDMGDYKQVISMIVTSLLLMVSAVVMVSAFIIYSSFKIIAIDRMPLMGTMRSIGATRKITVRILLFEAIFYGVSGGILGNGLGILILTVTLKMMFQNFGITVEGMSNFNLNYMLFALLIGLTLAVGSAMIPIIKMSKRSIRSIIFSEIHNEKHLSIIKTLVGVALVAIAFIIFHTAPIKVQLPLNMLGLLFVMVGGALVIPIVSNILIKILSFLLRPIYKDGLSIITANIKNDGTMMNNILLLAMGLGIILMINNFSSTVGIAVSDVYATGRADALVFSDMDSDFVEAVRNVEGVEHVYTTKQVMNITANDGQVDLMFVEGMDGSGYSKYAWDEFGSYLTEDLLQEYTSKRSILVSKFTARKYELEKGDWLSLDFDGTQVPYEIIGIVPSIMNNGNISFINEKFFAEDTGVDNYQSMYLDINASANMEQVLQKIKQLMPYGILPIQTLEEMQTQNVKANDGLFFMMKAISVIAMFIGVVGILNNFTISFLSRKKLIATMRSLGLSKGKTVKNMMLEAFFCGCLGTLSGLMLGTVLLKAMCYVVDAMGIPSDVMFYSMKDYLFVFISGIILSLVSAILPARSIAKENIVTGLRCE